MPESPESATDPTSRRATELLRAVLGKDDTSYERDALMRELANPDGDSLSEWMHRAHQR